MTRITPAMLRGACKEQRDIFKAEWPQGCEATIENVRRAQELGLDLEWGKRWFSPAAWDSYQAARAQAWASYQAATAPALASYEAATAPAWDSYEATIDSAWLAAFLASREEK